MRVPRNTWVRVGHVIEGHVFIAQIKSDSAVLPDGVTRGNQFGHELIVGLVLADRCFQPFRISIAGAPFHVRLQSEDVSPVVERIADVTLRIENVIDQLCPLAAPLRIQECFTFLFGWNAADNIQIDPPQEHFIRGRRIRLHLVHPVSVLNEADRFACCDHRRTRWTPAADAMRASVAKRVKLT